MKEVGENRLKTERNQVQMPIKFRGQEQGQGLEEPKGPRAGRTTGSRRGKAKEKEVPGKGGSS